MPGSMPASPSSGRGEPVIEIRPVRPTDYDAWLPLWDGYNEFYGRAGATALDPAITETTWKRFFDPGEPSADRGRLCRGPSGRLEAGVLANPGVQYSGP